MCKLRTCIRIKKRKVAAEWLLDLKESTDSEFKYDKQDRKS